MNNFILVSELLLSWFC